MSKARSILSIKISKSSSLVDFPNLEARVDVQVSIQSRRSEKASRTVASLSKFGDAGARAGKSRVASWALSCSISAVAATSSFWRVAVRLGVSRSSAV